MSFLPPIPTHGDFNARRFQRTRDHEATRQSKTSHLPEQTAAIRRHRGMQWGGDCSVAADFPENPVEEMRVVCDWGEIIKHLRHVAIRP